MGVYESENKKQQHPLQAKVTSTSWTIVAVTLPFSPWGLFSLWWWCITTRNLKRVSWCDLRFTLVSCIPLKDCDDMNTASLIQDRSLSIKLFWCVRIYLKSIPTIRALWLPQSCLIIKTAAIKGIAQEVTTAVGGMTSLTDAWWSAVLLSRCFCLLPHCATAVLPIKTGALFLYAAVLPLQQGNHQNDLMFTAALQMIMLSISTHLSRTQLLISFFCLGSCNKMPGHWQWNQIKTDIHNLSTKLLRECISFNGIHLMSF